MQMTNLQIELLKTFRYELSETQMLEIKTILSKYFAEKATDEMDKFCQQNGWNDETIENLSNAHLRTKYE
jgi:hypothetical protein